MENQDLWQERIVNVVAAEIRKHRTERKMSAQRLSDACGALGLPVPRAVLTNLENGRRPTISVAELLVIARALDVPPAHLIFPADKDAQVEPLPGATAKSRRALRWFTGQDSFEDIPNWDAEDREPMDQKYTVNLDDGTQQVWTGDFTSIMRAVSTDEVTFLRCTNGILINVAHVVTLVPVG